jgi:hypothetical protein
MITNPKILHDFEMELLRREPVDYEKNMRIAEALYEEARLLGVLPSKDPLEGIEIKIRMAKALNGVR